MLIDIGAFAAIGPLLTFLPGGYMLEEFIEQIISTILVHWLKDAKVTLTIFDRVLGLLPIPGITPVTVAVVRMKLLKNHTNR